MAKINIDLDFNSCKDHEDLIFRLQKITYANPGDKIEFNIDLSGTGGFLYADMLLLIVCLVLDLRKKNISIHGKVNADWDSYQAKYASRVNFFNLLGLVVPEGFSRHDSQGRFMEISSFDQGTIKTLHENLNLILANNTWIGREVLQLIFYCFYEIMDNVLVHSVMSHGWACAQTFENRREIRLVIADTGQGIHQALLANPKYGTINENEALELCIQRAVSAGKGIGFGLFATSEFIKLNHGDLIIHSGSHFLRNTV